MSEYNFEDSTKITDLLKVFQENSATIEPEKIKGEYEKLLQGNDLAHLQEVIDHPEQFREELIDSQMIATITAGMFAFETMLEKVALRRAKTEHLLGLMTSALQSPVAALVPDSKRTEMQGFVLKLDKTLSAERRFSTAIDERLEMYRKVLNVSASLKNEPKVRS